MRLFFLSVVDTDVMLVSESFADALWDVNVRVDGRQRDGEASSGYVEAFPENGVPGLPLCPIDGGKPVTVAKPSFQRGDSPVFAVECRRCGYSSVEVASPEAAWSEWCHNATVPRPA